MFSLQKKFLFSLLLFTLLLGLLELGTWAFLLRVASFRPYAPFFSSAEIRHPEILAVSYPVIDSLLGWSNPAPFEQYYSDLISPPDRADGTLAAKAAKPATAVKVIALGGSTTDPQTEQENWVKKLAEECTVARLQCHVLNGGNAGYTSTQELLKLERDVVPLRPSIVVSLNGINDESMSYFGGYSFTTPYQRELMVFLATALRDTRSPLYSPPQLSGPFPNTRFLLRLLAFFATKENASPAARINSGTRDDFSRGSRWEHNVRMMHAIAAEFGARYFVVLQPHLGLNPTEMNRQRETLGASGHFYSPEDVKAFYDEAGAACRQLPYCLDLSRDFPLEHRLFKDFMHLLPSGHALQAKKIFAFLMKQKAFSPLASAKIDDRRKPLLGSGKN